MKGVEAGKKGGRVKGRERTYEKEGKKFFLKKSLVLLLFYKESLLFYLF